MMLMIKENLKKKAKKKVIGIALAIIKPFIIPILIGIIFLALITSITDILYIAFDNDDKVDMKKELKYYDTEYEKQRDKEEVKGFFASVWDFVDKVFGGSSTEISEQTDWPVVGHFSISSGFGPRKAPTRWSIIQSFWNRYTSTRRNKISLYYGW